MQLNELVAKRQQKQKQLFLILGILYKVAEDSSYGDKILLPGQKNSKLQLYSKSLVQKELQAYYYYNGSFIESSCHEPVTWIIAKNIRWA